MIAADLASLATPVGDLVLLPGNPRRGDVGAVARSLERFGQRKPIVVRRSDSVVVAGNHTLQAAIRLGWPEIAAVWVDDDEATAQAFALADNRTAELGGYDEEALAAMVASVQSVDPELLAATGWSDQDLLELLAKTAPPVEGLTDPDAVPESPAEPVTKPGDLWLLGDHRLLCGDCSRPETVAALFSGVAVDAILTDPPYCSGGFQEAGRSAGSIGTDARIKPRIANDTLSTRGYMSLLKAVLSLSGPPLAYIFTDWRMWVNLFDVAESSGYGVRNMVVWDKGSPGMGMGWRTQHELVMFATKAAIKFDNHKAQGNVIAASRTGNHMHPTQKPVDLLTAILRVTDMAATVYDPFAGSGSTLMAAHQEGRRAYLMELDPRHCDVVGRRFQEFTGVQPVLEATGEPHDFTGGDDGPTDRETAEAS